MAEERRLKTVAVYCGAAAGKNPIYTEKAAELGTYLATNRIHVVYGGSRFGLLGSLADAVVANGGGLTGITPEFFTKYTDYQPAGEEIIVPDMHTRKKMMFDKVEAFIALPGGVGTMEELTEILTWSKLNLHAKPVALLNVEGYYDHFLQWLTRGIADGFIHQTGDVEELMVISESPKDLLDRLCRRWTEGNTAES